MHRLTAAALACTLLSCAAVAAPPLPRYNVAPGTVSVAGLSSGAFMAVQLHVAYSETFTRGAAVFAGGPYDCANGSGMKAVTKCMSALPAPPSADDSIRLTEERARAGAIDPTAALAKSKVYLFSGTKDFIVRQPVMDVVAAYYRHYLPTASVVYDNKTPASHAWVSPLGPQKCEKVGKLFLNNCGIDPAQTFLGEFYGPLKPKVAGAARGRLVEFDQKEFFDDHDPAEHSVADSGWAFVPADCAAGAACKAVVALHGCMQDYRKVGDNFIRRTGLNEWADTNRIVVLYPQTISKPLKNPNGCWDWWGYDDDAYAVKQGRQMRAVKAMVDRVMAAAPAAAGASTPAR